MFEFFEPREMLRSFAARGIYCFEISVKRVHTPGGIKRLRLIRNSLIKSSRGMFAYDSITVSYAWELISVSMCYSQGDGINTSLSRLWAAPTTYLTFLYTCSFLV